MDPKPYNYNETIQITYVSNAGVLIETGNHKILIDGLAYPEKKVYQRMPATIKTSIMYDMPPFEHIDVVLISHFHNDHFNADMVMEFFASHPDAHLVCPTQVYEMLQGFPFQHLTLMDPPLHQCETKQIDDITIHGFHCSHMGEAFRDVVNLSFALDMDGLILLHTGDTAPLPENFSPIKKKLPQIHVLMADFPYVGLISVRPLVKNLIAPVSLLAIHLPYGDLDQFGWVVGARRHSQHLVDAGITIQLFEHTGQIVFIHRKTGMLIPLPEQ